MRRARSGALTVSAVLILLLEVDEERLRARFAGRRAADLLLERAIVQSYDAKFREGCQGFWCSL